MRDSNKIARRLLSEHPFAQRRSIRSPSVLQIFVRASHRKKLPRAWYFFFASRPTEHDPRHTHAAWRSVPTPRLFFILMKNPNNLLIRSENSALFTLLQRRARIYTTDAVNQTIFFVRFHR